jgi:hypothetical protein
MSKERDCMNKKFLTILTMLIVLSAVTLLASEPHVAAIDKKITFEEAKQFFDNTQDLYHKDHNKYYPGVVISQFWERAGIKPEPLRFNSDLYLFNYKVGQDEECNIHYPQIEIYSNEGLKILQVGVSVQWSYQLFLFKRSGDAWVYFDHIDLEMQKYGPPEITFWDNGLIRVKSLSSSGTGTMHEISCIYSTNDNTADRVLIYTDRHHRIDWGMLFDRDIKSDSYYREGVLYIDYNIKISSSTNYFDPKSHYGPDGIIPMDFSLFNVRRSARFNWNGKEFLLNEAASNLSLEDMDNFYEGGNVQYYQMFKDKIDELGVRGNDIHKKWYKAFTKRLQEEV